MNQFNIKFGIDAKLQLVTIGQKPLVQSARYGTHYNTNATGFGALIEIEYKFLKSNISLTYSTVLRYDLIQYQLRNINPKYGRKEWFTDHHLFIKKYLKKSPNFNIGFGFSLISPGQGFHDTLVPYDTTNTIPNHWFPLGYYSLDLTIGWKIKSFNIDISYLFSPRGVVPYMFNQSVGNLRFVITYEISTIKK